MCSGGSSGSSQPTTSTVYNTNLPSYLQGPVSQLAGQAGALTNTGQNPYQSYIGNAAAGGQGIQGTTVAGLTPMQQQAMQGMQGMTTAPQMDQATGMMGTAGLNAMNAGNTYNPFNATNQYNPTQLGSMNIGYQQAQGAQGTAAQMAGPQQFTGQNVQQYMNPYLQTTQNAAISNYANSLPSLGSAATNVGGLGGSREALMQSQAQQGLQQTLAGNVNNAFQNAQNQFNTSQAQQLQAGQANLGAQMQAEQQNVGNQQQANLANQQAGLTSQGQALNQLQNLNQLGVGQASNLAQYGLGAQQLNANQQQFLANLGLQGNTAAMNAAQGLGSIGQNLYNQQMGILSGQNQFGTQQQNVNQAVNNALNQNFQNYTNYPYAQMAFLSGILHGTSPGALGSQGTTSTYSQAPNVAGQIAGLGIGAAGLSQALGGKKGGRVYDKEHSSGIAHAFAHLGD